GWCHLTTDELHQLRRWFGHHSVYRLHSILKRSVSNEQCIVDIAGQPIKFRSTLDKPYFMEISNDCAIEIEQPQQTSSKNELSSSNTPANFTRNDLSSNSTSTQKQC
ncbi:hypothetical protein OnM2_081051, partial [Erysiphe neolycopersici]